MPQELPAAEAFATIRLILLDACIGNIMDEHEAIVYDYEPQHNTVVITT